MTKSLKHSSKYIVYASGVLLFFCAFLTAIEVILRKFFLFSLGGVDEISSYVLAITVSWSIAYVLFEKMHIRIDIFYHMISKKFQNYLDLLSMLMNFIFIAIITYYAFDVFLSSWEKNSLANTPLGTPLWIPQLLWFAGFTFFLIVIFVLLYKSIQNIYSKEKNDYSDIKKEIEC
ncbi:TRAP transporter small permease subunit [Poseidonibacter lekithochrous]|uniref:TRAP transporter small permease subunit n=1 Tax=Poseidonibacter lekithochrous TaxID=1904463 RepID=UPI0008FC7918|nr:TRAP transporter small permease [Poseidonibacter lekithochrous]QKJ23641.1 TRAP transporter, small permease subunit [Poseidonibacter lekithochrous]